MLKLIHTVYVKFGIIKYTQIFQSPLPNHFYLNQIRDVPYYLC